MKGSSLLAKRACVLMTSNERETKRVSGTRNKKKKKKK